MKRDGRGEVPKPKIPRGKITQKAKLISCEKI